MTVPTPVVVKISFEKMSTSKNAKIVKLVDSLDKLLTSTQATAKGVLQAALWLESEAFDKLIFPNNVILLDDKKKFVKHAITEINYDNLRVACQTAQEIHSAYNKFMGLTFDPKWATNIPEAETIPVSLSDFAA